MMPRAGGVYVFLREAYGHSIGFLYGWTLFLVIQTGTIAAVAIAFAKFLGVFVMAVSPENYLVSPISLGHYAISLSTEQLVAIGLIALLTWSNTRGLEVGKIIQNTFTFAKTAALTAVVVIGLSLGWNARSAALSANWWDSWANGWSPQIAQPGFTLAGRKIDGGSTFRANRLDECHIYRQRNTPSGKKSRARAGSWLRQRGCSLCTGQSRLRRCIAVPGNSACAAKPGSGSDDERHLRSSRCDVHGSSDHDLHFWL
jgi:hypothetical protein